MSIMWTFGKVNLKTIKEVIVTNKTLQYYLDEWYMRGEPEPSETMDDVQKHRLAHKEITELLKKRKEE